MLHVPCDDHHVALADDVVLAMHPPDNQATTLFFPNALQALFSDSEREKTHATALSSGWDVFRKHLHRFLYQMEIQFIASSLRTPVERNFMRRFIA